MPFRLSKHLELPDEAATDANAILAKRGAGKSNAAVVLAEEMHDAGVPWVAVDPKGDWWGIRAPGDGPGLPVPVLGGLHGDVPLEPGAGKVVADLVAEENLSVVLDVSEFDAKGDQVRFLADFAERLYRLHGKSQDLRHLFLEEADEYVPQREARSIAACRRRWMTIATKGRQRGLGITLVTQRSAIVDKDVLTQTDTLVAMRVTAPQDRKAILGWVDYHDVAKEVVDSLPTLADGEAWVCSPQRLGEPVRTRFRRRRTFDSGATPGRKSQRKAAEMGEVDLAALRDRMADAVERADADDPAKLRARIAELERELRGREPETSIVEVPVVPEEVREALEQIDGLAAESEKRADRLSEDVRELGVIVGRARVAARQVQERERPSERAPTVARKEPVRQESEALDGLKAGARNMVRAVAEAHPMILTKAQVASLAGNKSVKSSTFRTYWSQVMRVGFVEEAPGGFRATERALVGCGIVGTQDPAAVRARLRSALKEGARRMLDVLDQEGGWVSKDELAARSGMSENMSSTFRTYLSTLKRNGLAEVDGNRIRAVWTDG